MIEGIKPPVFKRLSSDPNISIGIALDPNDTLFNNRFLLYDWGTYYRPFDFDSELKSAVAWHYIARSSPKILFGQLDSFKEALEESRLNEATKENLKTKVQILKNRDPSEYNEVLARIRWNVQSSWLIACQDNLETRIFVQGYAAQLKSALIKRSRALSKRNIPGTFYPVDMDYEVPIGFYVPNSETNKAYDIFDQSLDNTERLEEYFSDFDKKYFSNFDREEVLFKIIRNNDVSLLWRAVNSFIKKENDSERAELIAELLARSLKHRPACAEILLQIAGEWSVRPLLLFFKEGNSFQEALDDFLLDYAQINFDQKSYQQCIEYALAQPNLKQLDVLLSQETLFQGILKDKHFISSNALLSVNNAIKTFLRENPIPWPVILKLNDLSFELFNVNFLRKTSEEITTKFTEDREEFKTSLRQAMESSSEDENIIFEAFTKLDQLIRSVLDLCTQDEFKSIKDKSKMLGGLMDYCLNIYTQDADYFDLSELSKRYDDTISLLQDLHRNFPVGLMPSFFNPEKKLKNAIDGIIKTSGSGDPKVLDDPNRPSTSQRT